MTVEMETKIYNLIQEFRTAVYGKDVRRTYADIAEAVCIEAMKKIDKAVDQGNYAESQGDYAKLQGDYAKKQGDYAGTQTDTALAKIQQEMFKIQAEFGDIQSILQDSESGKLLLEIQQLLNDMYRQSTDTDIDNIIAGTYVDEDEEGSIFEVASEQDIDDIIAGTYTDAPEGSTEEGTSQNITEIVNNAF